jgi:hypothetical protein
VCHVAIAANQMGDALVAISRCRAFTPADNSEL